MKRKFSPSEIEMLEKLKALPEEQIDTADIPEAPRENWRLARRGELYKPMKQPVTIRIDADVLAWFKKNSQGQRYQTEINKVLRHHVARNDKGARR
jgi:uncharacterized protein (DUF4415 family)